jgi:hypothetical protein
VNLNDLNPLDERDDFDHALEEAVRQGRVVKTLDARSTGRPQPTEGWMSHLSEGGPLRTVMTVLS